MDSGATSRSVAIAEPPADTAQALSFPRLRYGGPSSPSREKILADWNPALYSRFEGERTRPARDLLARVPLEAPAAVVDLGCGPGNSTELLIARFPQAHVTGLDSSPAMVEAAQQRIPACRFEQADIATWSPAHAPDLIFANAVLQWLPDHLRLVPRLFDSLKPGGVLAIQMPDNLEEPSHRGMRNVAADGPWSARLAPAIASRAALPPLSAYYDMLAPKADTVDVWRTAYQHPMESAAAIVDWVRATGLRPFLDRLDPGEQPAFLEQYEAEVARSYPPRADGQRLLGFPRIFLVARRPQ